MAIEQAGGFIRANGISIARYGSLYESHKSEALKEGLSMAHRELYYKHTIATTWEVSLKAVEGIDLLASKILHLAAFLNGKNIQKDLFMDELATFQAEWGMSSSTKWEVTKSFGALLSYS